MDGVSIYGMTDIFSFPKALFDECFRWVRNHTTLYNALIQIAGKSDEYFNIGFDRDHETPIAWAGYGNKCPANLVQSISKFTELA